jgi:catechol 2,3-dioxygenase-like lactoylglutathione lyase family enzyme
VSAPPDLVAFHLGFVVHDVDATAARYRRLLGVERWHIRERTLAKIPWDERTTDSRMKFAYGHGAGLTFELIQVLDGEYPHSQFLRAHGEGVQHIGFWTPDVRRSVEAAVAEGAQITLAMFDQTSNVVVQLTPGSDDAAVLKAISSSPMRMAYVDPRLATVQLEFVGPAAVPGLRDWLKEDFDAWLVPPPWETPAPDLRAGR